MRKLQRTPVSRAIGALAGVSWLVTIYRVTVYGLDATYHSPYWTCFYVTLGCLFAARFFYAWRDVKNDPEDGRGKRIIRGLIWLKRLAFALSVLSVVTTGAGLLISLSDNRDLRYAVVLSSVVLLLISLALQAYVTIRYDKVLDQYGVPDEALPGTSQF